MKNFISKIFLFVVIIGLVCLSVGAASDEPIKIGITQIVEHPALNAVRDAVIDELEEAGYVRGEDVVYLLKNAQGDLTNANAIAQNFKAQDLDIIVSIATPTSQAIKQVIKDTPIVATAVTDFVEAGLVDSYEAYDDPSGNGNLTGVTDMTPVEQQFELIKQLNPLVEKVGIVYNPGEANSAFLTEVAKDVAEEMGLVALEATATSSADVAPAAQSLKGRVDAIWVSTDNLVVSALPSVAKVANEENIPLVTADPTTIDKGALAALGFDYYKHGRVTGRVVLRIIKGESPNEIPIQRMSLEDLPLAINLDVANKIGLEFPDDLIKEATQLVYGGKIWEAK